MSFNKMDSFTLLSSFESYWKIYQGLLSNNFLIGEHLGVMVNKCLLSSITVQRFEMIYFL